MGEVCGLRFKDVSLVKGIITVSNQIHWEAGEYTLIPPKCGTISSITLNNIAKSLIQKQSEIHFSKPNDFVFISESGLPYRKDGFLKYHFERAISDLQSDNLIDKDKRITFHSLRHTYASMLVNLNENIFTVQHLFRHKDFKLTYNTYAHMYPDKKPESFGKIDNEFSFVNNFYQSEKN